VDQVENQYLASYQQCLTHALRTITRSGGALISSLFPENRYASTELKLRIDSVLLH
jgi:hypothetical protein